MAVIPNPDKVRATARRPQRGLQAVSSMQGNAASTGTSSARMMLSEQQVSADSGGSLDLRAGLRSKTLRKGKGNAHTAADGLRRVGGAGRESQCFTREQERPSCSPAVPQLLATEANKTLSQMAK